MRLSERISNGGTSNFLSSLAESMNVEVEEKEVIEEKEVLTECEDTTKGEEARKTVEDQLERNHKKVEKTGIEEAEDEKEEEKLEEDSYEDSIYSDIEDALLGAGLNVVRYTEAGMMTKNLGWVVETSEGEVNLTCDGTWLDENFNLSEALNPENETINALIRKIVNGDSKAFKTLEKLGYEVTYDNSARKAYGRRSFGDTIVIKNPKTGKEIYASVGHDWPSDDVINARPTASIGSNDDRNRHRIKGKAQGRNGASEERQKSFDYKNYLDKETPDLSGDRIGDTVDQFKKDKKFLKDKEYDAQRIDAARERLAAIRGKMNK